MLMGLLYAFVSIAVIVRHIINHKSMGLLPTRVFKYLLVGASIVPIFFIAAQGSHNNNPKKIRKNSAASEAK